MVFTMDSQPGSALPHWLMADDAAAFTARYGPLSCFPSKAFDAGLRPGPFPGQNVSLLPASLAITQTGLSPAGSDELPIRA
jgi:hypothetical protein